jgi:cardiolipin synthase (CMP-forming)
MSRFGVNLPNLISLGRLLLVPLAIWLILGGHYGVAFWVFVAAGVSDALDGFIAKRFDRRTRLGALLDPVADKALLVSVYVTLGLAHQLWTSLVILVVFRDVMIIGGFILIQAIAAPKHFAPLYISKINTGLQIALVAFVLARLGLGTDSGMIDVLLSLAVAATTLLSGLSYLVRWARILARSEQAL